MNTKTANTSTKRDATIEKHMKKYAVAPMLSLLLICGSVHADETSSADQQMLIHDANAAMSQHNYSVAFGKYLKLAEQGNAAAQLNVGVMYLNGLGVQQDGKLAFAWLGKSAARGNGQALSVMKKAAAQGNAYAQNELALLPGPAAGVQGQLQQTSAAKPDEQPSTMPAKGEDGNKSERTVSFSVGFDNTSGNYGTKQESTSTSIPAIVSYGTDSYSAAQTLPYMEQTGPAGSIAGTRRHISGSNKILSEQGPGDVLASVTGYVIDNEDSGISLDVKAQVKFGTADVSKGLGTGKNDYSLEADVYKDFDKAGLSGSLGYSDLGSPGKVVVTGVQENIILHNVFYGSVGASYQVTEATKVGLTLNAEQSSENGMPRQEDLTLDFTRKINKANKLNFYVLKGLANGSPDKGFGASFKYLF